jgi:hypothetical protein
LAPIGAGPFCCTPLSSVVVPENASPIAGSVFPVNCGRSGYESGCGIGRETGGLWVRME